MSEYRVVAEYPHPLEQVWKALVDPSLVPRWTSTGRGARPVGFQPRVGVRFQLIGKPVPGWNGVVDCEVLEVEAPRLLRYSWKGGPDDEVTTVTNRLEDIPGGTRLTFHHHGFRGPGGWLMSRLLGSVRKKMLEAGLRPLLDELGAAYAEPPAVY